MNDFYDFFAPDDSMCDCCGVSIDGHELHTVEGVCPVTLCRSCIMMFYAILDRNSNSNNLRMLRIINSDGKNDQN